MPSSCQLCLAVGGGDLGVSTRGAENSILHATQSFVVIPDAVPLAPGHVMVVGREHYFNLVAMGDNAILEYEKIREQIAGMPRYGQNFLEIEHGSTAYDCGGACVSHVHVHIIPDAAEIYDLFNEPKVPLIAELSSLADLVRFSQSYIMLRKPNAPPKVFRAENLISKFMKREVIKMKELQRLNLLNNPKKEWVQETLSIWGHNGATV